MRIAARTLAIVLTLLAGGCTDQPSLPTPDPFAIVPGQERVDEALASRYVTAYLTAAAGRLPDRGWSLLHPDVRAITFGDDAAAYRAAVLQGTWSGFTFRLRHVERDDLERYLVDVHLTGARGLAPVLVDEAVQIVGLRGATLADLDDAHDVRMVVQIGQELDRRGVYGFDGRLPP